LRRTSLILTDPEAEEMWQEFRRLLSEEELLKNSITAHYKDIIGGEDHESSNAIFNQFLKDIFKGLGELELSKPDEELMTDAERDKRRMLKIAYKDFIFLNSYLKSKESQEIQKTLTFKTQEVLEELKATINNINNLFNESLNDRCYKKLLQAISKQDHDFNILNVIKSWPDNIFLPEYIKNLYVKNEIFYQILSQSEEVIVDQKIVKQDIKELESEIAKLKYLIKKLKKITIRKGEISQGKFILTRYIEDLKLNIEKAKKILLNLQLEEVQSDIRRGNIDLLNKIFAIGDSSENIENTDDASNNSVTKTPIVPELSLAKSDHSIKCEDSSNNALENRDWLEGIKTLKELKNGLVVLDDWYPKGLAIHNDRGELVAKYNGKSGFLEYKNSKSELDFIYTRSSIH